MCVVKIEMELASSPKKHWTSRIFRQPVKPKLSRKITNSARLNLNRYWSKFEELYKQPSYTGRFSGVDKISTHQLISSADHTNEINENLANELRENNNGRCRTCTTVDFAT